jgi:intracellular septation protein A
LADSFFKEELISLIIAVCISFAELAITFAVYQKADLFILFDLILISAMAMISIAFKNPLFFKLKPAVIESIFFIFIIPLCFSIKFLTGYMNRYLKGIEIDEKKIRIMQKNIFLLLPVLLIHIILIVISAIYFSREVWGFVSGILLYILFGVPLFFMIIFKRLHNKKRPQMIEEPPVSLDERR